jgi:hypothetical protein
MMAPGSCVWISAEAGPSPPGPQAAERVQGTRRWLGPDAASHSDVQSRVSAAMGLPPLGG